MSASVWRKCRLDQVSDINPQTGAIPNEFVYVDLESVVAGKLLSVNFLSKKDAPSRAQRNLSSGDILYQTVRPYQRNNYFFEGDKRKYVASTGYAQIKAKEFNKYLYHYLHTDDFISDVLSRCTGTSYPAIAPKELSRVLVYLPQNREEQKRISDILSTCDTVIQNTQKTIDKYKAIKQGMMQDLFTRGLTKDGKLRPSYKEAPELYKESELGIIPKEWEVKTLGNCANKPEYGLNTPAVDYDGRIGYLRITDIDDDSHRFMKEGITSPLEFSEEYKLSEGDLVFARTGASVGKTYIYDSKDENLYFAGFLIRFKILDSYCAKYIFYNTLLPRYKNWVTCYSMRTGQPGVNAEEFATYKLPIPLLGEQIEIAKRLSSIDSTIQKEETILAKYKKIKTGLMARLLTPPEDAEIINETGE